MADDKESFWNLFKLGRIKAMLVTAVGKPGVETAPDMMRPLIEVAAPASAAFGQSVLSIVLFGGFGTLSAVTNQIEYLSERAELTDFYREELAAKNHTDKKKVGDDDLSKGEKTNNVIRKAVSRERHLRNLGIAASFVASIAVYALVETIGIHIPMELSLPFAAKVAMSVLTYLSIKSPLVKIGKVFFGMEKETTHDLIAGITRDREQGKAITREQVVEVFISGNKQISDYVERSFGKGYEELPLADKVRLSAELANVLPIDKIVHNINLNTARASELAFTVQGDVSGALPKMPDRPKEATFLERCVRRCQQVVQSVGNMFSAEEAEIISTISAINQSQQSQESQSPVVEMNNGPSFVERLGRAPHEAGKGHVERLAERGAQQPIMMPGSSALQ
ncbi:MAG: hypothetical protein SFX19_02315 [Alphaproteobacteria bacterium]|nr:hypothetical protein [Alphaproteobacteria bacterium]